MPYCAINPAAESAATERKLMRAIAYAVVTWAGLVLFASPVWSQVEVVSQNCEAVVLDPVVACEVVLLSQAGAAATLSLEAAGMSSQDPPGSILAVAETQPASHDIGIYNGMIYTMGGILLVVFDYDLVRLEARTLENSHLEFHNGSGGIVFIDDESWRVESRAMSNCGGCIGREYVKMVEMDSNYVSTDNYYDIPYGGGSWPVGYRIYSQC